jgi:hypothetical protein
MILQRQPQHGQAPGVARARLAGFQGRLAARHEKHGVQAELLEGVPGEQKMPVMHRVKRPAVNAKPELPPTTTLPGSREKCRGVCLHASTT